MLLGLAVALLMVLVLALLLLPLLRSRTGAAARRADFDIEVYLDQLRELDRDVERGVIGAADAESARTEIERRLLAADRAPRTGAAAAMLRTHPVLAALLIVLVPVGAGALYGQLGSPALPDLPFAARAPAAEDDVLARTRARIGEAEAAVRDRPDDARAWFDLGRLRFFAHRAAEAANAFAEAARLAPDRGDYAAAWAEALTVAAQGTVTPRAREVLDMALERDPGDPRARFYRALAAQQAGDTAGALDRLVALLRDSPADAPWRDRVAERIRALAGELGRDGDALVGETAPAPPAGGPSAADVAAAQQMSPEERTAMIRSMVEGLAAKLEAAPGDVAGWRRLGQSWTVLGEHARASEAYGKALAIEPNDAQTLFNGATAAVDADDRATALDRFTRLKALIPPDTEAYGAVERAIGRLQ